MPTLQVMPMYQGSFTSSWAEPLLLPVLTDRTWVHIVDIVDIIDISLSYRYVHLLLARPRRLLLEAVQPQHGLGVPHVGAHLREDRVSTAPGLGSRPTLRTTLCWGEERRAPIHTSLTCHVTTAAWPSNQVLLPTARVVCLQCT